MSDATTRPGNAVAALVQQANASLGRNDAEKAELALLQALALAPDDANALQLLAAVCRSQGRVAEAEANYARVIAHHPALPQAHHNLGNLLAEQGRYASAVEAHREAIKLKPNFAQAHLGLAAALSALGDHASAAMSCSQALRLQPNLLLAKMTLAAELNELDRPKEAEQSLRQMLALGLPDPNMVASIENNLGVALKKQNRLEEALSFFEAARARAPGIPTVHCNKGDTLLRLGRLEEAFESFRRAIGIEPGNAAATAQAALIAARLNDFENARNYGARTLAVDGGNGVARVALAIAEMGSGDFAAAESMLRLVLDDATVAGESQSNLALGLAADALDGYGKISSAFTVYAGANERRRDQAVRIFESNRVIDEVARLTRYFAEAPLWAAAPASVPDRSAADGHVFILGFMRSGTTLLTSVLASHTNVVASDEREYLTGPARAFLLNETGLSHLATADDRELARWRQDYWSSVHVSGLSVTGKIFVDKMPFNSLRLPLIARLFPGAKVLFAIRDPRDVVFSCFRRHFDMTPFSFEFLRLEDCARFYASVMALCGLYRTKLALEIEEFRYEDMVRDYKPTVARVCAFIGAGWQDAMLDFTAAASAIDQRSASALQVRRGLYSDGVGQWRRYRDQLAPALPILRPWIERFGYPSD